jgi:hypothetical protein
MVGVEVGRQARAEFGRLGRARAKRAAAALGFRRTIDRPLARSRRRAIYVQRDLASRQILLRRDEPSYQSGGADRDMYGRRRETVDEWNRVARQKAT